MSYELDNPNDHVFVPVKAQTGCARCGYARGQHPTARMLRTRTESKTAIEALRLIIAAFHLAEASTPANLRRAIRDAERLLAPARTPSSIV